MALCNNDDTPFYHSDQGDTNQLYRIFSYHFTDKDSWMLPDALEARGIMFEIDREGNPLRIASRPMQKFFNKGEVDFVDYGLPHTIMVKADGSLISSYTDVNGNIQCKSKTSIGSDYAKLANELLYADAKLFEFVYWCEHDGYTVNMELVAPDPFYRIVLYYDKPQLIVLNARHRDTGEYMRLESMPDNYFTGTVTHDELAVLEEAKNIEGYVVVDDKGNWWKEKCPWYLERHRAKDFVNSPLAFVELCLKDEADDVYAMVSDQPQIVAELQEIQHRVVTIANTIVNTVTDYWQSNKDLGRKEYAIKGQQELTRLEFPLAMQYYSKGAEPNWKEYLLKMIKKVEW
jgi:T4 RnlA family RNA ligase